MSSIELQVKKNRPDPLELAMELYPDIEQDIKDLQKAKYLDDDGNILLALLYLTTVKPKSKKSPWTKHHEQVLRSADRADRTTEFWLRYGLIPLIFLSMFGLLGLLSLIPGKSEVTYGVVISTVCTITIATVTVSVLSFYFTGIFPDASSVKANARQNTVMYLKELYRQFATDILRIAAENKKLGKAIAVNLDIRHLRATIRKRSHDKYSDFVFNDLQEATNYIANPRENFPHKPFLHLYLAEISRGSLPSFRVKSRSHSRNPSLSDSTFSDSSVSDPQLPGNDHADVI